MEYKSEGQLTNRVQSDVQNRINNLEQNLRSLCEQHDSLAELIKLLESMPLVKRTQVALKQLNQDLNESAKTLSTVQQTLMVSQNANMNISIERNFKNLSASVTQIRNSIKECQTQISETQLSRQAQYKQESASVLKVIMNKLERNKKEIMKNLNDVKEELSQNRALQETQKQREALVKSTAQQLQRNYKETVNKLYWQVGALRCDIEFIKDKTRKRKILETLRSKQLLKGKDSSQQQYILGVTEQQIFLDELTAFHQQHSQRLSKQLRTIEERLNSFIKFLQSTPQLKPHEKDHILKQLAYAEDLRMNLKHEISGAKKKYLVEMRKLEDKFEQLSLMKSETQVKELQVEALEEKFEKLNNSIGMHIKNVAEAEDLLGRLSSHLQMISSEVIDK